MNVHYRAMHVEDLSAVFSVRLSTVENAITMDELKDDYDITPESLAEAMGTDVRGWVCEESGAVVGFAMGDRSNGEVQVVAVLPEVEGHGIGGTLLDLVTQWLFSEGYDEIWLRSNPNPTNRAYGFYRKLGWVEAERMIGDDEVMIFPKKET